MNDLIKPSITIQVDATNPGQFFACCGLLEIADRLWPGAEAWFEENDIKFNIKCQGTLIELLQAAKTMIIDDKLVSQSEEEEEEKEEEEEEEEEEEKEKEEVIPVKISSPFILRLDWWADRSIKTWAGTMDVHRIAFAMANAINPDDNDPLNQNEVVFDPPKPNSINKKRRLGKPKKREPFYFDSLRGPNAHARDIGFSPNDLKLATTASPVLELFSLIGLQRCRPKLTSRARVFEYFTWTIPMPVSIVAVSVNGLLPFPRANRYRFENKFRTGQEKHKAFMPAIPLTHQGDF